MSLIRSGFIAAVLAVAAIGAAAGPAAAAAKSFTAMGTQADGEFFFEFEGVDGRNPTVTLDPGDEVTITFTSTEGVHNLHVVGLGIDEKTDTLQAGDAASVLTFTVPADAAGKKIDYWCDPHKGLNMAGVFQVSGEAAPGDGDSTKEAPGVEAGLLALAALGAALLVSRRRA